jgi:transposase
LLLVGGAGQGPGEHGDDEPGDHGAGLDAQTKTLSASERDGVLRRTWSKLAALVDPSAWVWLDETGSNLGYTQTHARAPQGQRAYATAPRNHGENKTLLVSLSLAGVGPTLRFDGAMTTARFDGYVCHVLAPTLRPGQIVVADNLRAHHSDRARAAIEARGALFWHLPPYSPDFNPIEEAFSKVKQFLRRAQARTDDALRSATWAALATITHADIDGWFSHCGYRTRDQES